MHKILILKNAQVNSLKWILSPFYILSYAMKTNLLQYGILADLLTDICWKTKPVLRREKNIMKTEIK